MDTWYIMLGVWAAEHLEQGESPTRENLARWNCAAA